MARTSATRAVLQIPARIELTESTDVLLMRRLKIRELVMAIETLAMKLGAVFEDNPGMSRQKWTSLGPMLIASMGKPVFEWLGKITSKSAEQHEAVPCGADYIADLDMLDFTLVARCFFDLHEEALGNLSGLFERAKAAEDSKADSNSGSIPSSAEATDLTKSETSTSAPSVPSLRSPPQGRQGSRPPSLGSSTPPIQRNSNATSAPTPKPETTTPSVPPAAEGEELTSGS